jgi:hypothetical protein
MVEYEFEDYARMNAMIGVLYQLQIISTIELKDMAFDVTRRYLKFTK